MARLCQVESQVGILHQVRHQNHRVQRQTFRTVQVVRTISRRMKDWSTDLFLEKL